MRGALESQEREGLGYDVCEALHLGSPSEWKRGLLRYFPGQNDRDSRPGPWREA